MCAREESNLDLELRKLTFYPLDYGRPTMLRFSSELRWASSMLNKLLARPKLKCDLSEGGDYGRL